MTVLVIRLIALIVTILALGRIGGNDFAMQGVILWFAIFAVGDLHSIATSLKDKK